ncbi:hypothetical protein AVEN_110563-1 [Araneus ventricosus]|uniref:Integrase catalytic domain-containing protein n=1 Tax=Araneus ventricosus TaxID=182803 RepID=A0A4Y2RFJ2_ARAVE|nr:hypothetical protein AVEN_134613-1 [Araneus ventricosus]GBN74514.1 hypothetical protein AVEN_110563-1 [Araneus ventricosus]
MLQGGFELGDWESTGFKTERGLETSVLGMKWNHQLDSLRVNMSWMNESSLEKITKRIMLSAAHKVFVPVRENFWILNGRKIICKVISKHVICKRFSSKRLEVDSGPLPENRVRDAAVFQITGVDAAGLLFLKGNHKAWVLLFTCTVYRAVHLELITSLSTEAFLMDFRRFVAKRRRCSTIYCDNRTNFVGTVNAIDWKFNWPTAASWRGWWERLIRIMKDLLKRVLGQSWLLYEEMLTILCDCEVLINSRPLTYVSESEHLVPISPSFLQDIKEWSNRI